MSITVRLEPLLEKKIGQLSRQAFRTKSDIIKTSLRHYLKLVEEKNSPYLLGRDLFGRQGSGQGNLSTDKNLLKKKIREKYHR